MYPRRSPTTHTEQLGDEASVYDWAHGQVHALNPTAARVWRLCDGVTSSDAIAEELHRETGIAEADAVVDLTLKELARLHLVDLPIESLKERPAPTRRWLLGRGLTAAMLPAVYSILAPSPVEAQSPGGPAAPTLTSVSPNQGTQGTTVAVTLIGTNFIVGATTVTVSGSGVTVTNVVVGNSTSLTANFVLGAAASAGARTVTVTTAAGTSGGQTFTINLPQPSAPTLTSVSPNQGTQGTTVAVTLTGTNFVVGATTVTVGGSGVTVTNVVVGSSSTSLTASFVLGPAAAAGARTVTVTTAGGTSGGQTFTINLLQPVAPTLTSVSPNRGVRGTTVVVTLTGTNFVVGATTVAIGGTGVRVTNVVVGGSTSLTASFVLDPNAVAGAVSVTVTTASGTSGGQTFLITPPQPGAPTLTSVSPNQGTQGTSVAVTLTGTNFIVGITTLNVSGAGVTVTNVVVGSATSLTASFGLDPAAVFGPRTVTVTTAAGTSGGQTFTINVPPGSAAFAYTGSPVTFTVPVGVTSVTIQATGGAGGKGSGSSLLDPRAMGGRTTATVSVVSSSSLTVRVGGVGPDGSPDSVTAAGGFNGGGGSAGDGGGGGGASSVHDGVTPLVIAGGGAGGGSSSPGAGNGGNGGNGGGLTASAGVTALLGGGGGGGGTQAASGSGGARGAASGTDGAAGVTGAGGTGGAYQPGVFGGGGGGGGYFGGGGGGGGTPSRGAGGGGGGSSFAALSASSVLHEQGVNVGNGSVTISW